MLATLLPGIRDLRAPLAAGYLWLVAGWLAIAPLVPSRADATGAYRDVLDLADAASVFGIAVVASFVAYVLGVFAEVPAGWFRAWNDDRQTARIGLSRNKPAAITRLRLQLAYIVGPTRARRLRSAHMTSPTALASRSALRVSEIVAEKLSTVDAHLLAAGAPSLWTLVPAPWPPAPEELEALDEEKAPEEEPAHIEETDAPLSDVRRALGDELLERASNIRWLAEDERAQRAGRAVPSLASEAQSALTSAVLRELVAEAGLMRTRLVGVDQQLFSIIDRIRAEAEFRAAIFPPIAAIGSVLTVRGEGAWWMVIGLAAAIVLAWQAMTRWSAAMNRLFDALVLERVSAPVLDRLDTAIAALAAKTVRPPLDP